MKTLNPPFFCILFLIMFTFSQPLQLVYGCPGLKLTVTTDRAMYYLQIDYVEIRGNFTVDGYPVPEGLVALEVDNPNNHSVVIRTLQTDTAPTGAAINITNLFLCTETGEPIPGNSIKKGSYLAYFNVTVKNIGSETLPLLIAVNFYQNFYPFKTILPWFPENPPLHPGDGLSIVTSFIIPDRVSIGNVTMYASAFSNYPRLGGYPYCQERSSTFKIVDPSDPPSETTVSATNQSSDGAYSFVFKIPLSARRGNYTVHVSASYGVKQATNSTTIKVKLPGDVDDNGRVGFVDLFALAGAYGSKPGDSNWDPDCDFDRDGRVCFVDLFVLAAFYGREA